MPIRPEILAAIGFLGILSYGCRAAGFFLMRYVAITPRVEAWLRAMPIALIGAIVGPAAAKGGPPEWLGLAAAIGLMRATGNDFIAVAGAVGLVAGTRALGF
ncbi:MAG: AzlD family protein [Ferrovibrionaceae bacterium]